MLAEAFDDPDYGDANAAARAGILTLLVHLGFEDVAKAWALVICKRDDSPPGSPTSFPKGIQDPISAPSIDPDGYLYTAAGETLWLINFR